MKKKDAVKSILERKDPGRFVYAPNYWQWFTHQKNHNNIPDALQNCESQLDCIRHLELDVFSRNTYSNPNEYWFGGLTEKKFDNVRVEKKSHLDGKDTITIVRYITPKGELEERFRYMFSESTLVQEKFLIDDMDSQKDAFEDLICRTGTSFIQDKYYSEQEKVGDDGLIIAGDFYSPLKMLHLLLGPVETTFFLSDHEDFAREIMAMHERDQLNLLDKMIQSGVPAVMSMDNLDTMFHPPRYVEKYSASFYERASAMCRDGNSNFFIHACGQQKDNLKLISSLGVDGLEGVAYPPLGDVTLKEAFEMTDDRFIITGGISARETRDLTTRDSVFDYVEQLLEELKPYRHRFVLSASCNTPIDTPWETIVNFRDAWREFS